MSFADEMRRKSLEAQSSAAEKERAEEAKALALEDWKRNNCIPELKQNIQREASKGLRKMYIKVFLLEKGEDYKDSTKRARAAIENLELNSFLEMRSLALDEYDRMRIAFIKAEPGLSLELVGEIRYDNSYDLPEYIATATLNVVW